MMGFILDFGDVCYGLCRVFIYDENMMEVMQ